jgi:hypothetical protein
MQLPSSLPTIRPTIEVAVLLVALISVAPPAPILPVPKVVGSRLSQGWEWQRTSQPIAPGAIVSQSATMLTM